MHCCQVRFRQVHTLVHFLFFCILTFFSTHGFDFPPAQRELNQPPTVPSLSLFLFLHVQYCTLIAFQAPLCLPVFQLQSVLALPSFVSSKLSLHLSRLYSSPSFFSSPASNLLSSLLTCARFPSLISFFLFWGAHAHLLLFL